MANQKIFCNVPWIDLHLNWDGSFGACCYESKKIYNTEQSDTYNISNMSIINWYNSKPMQQFRQKIISDEYLTECSYCYHREKYNFPSKRVSENYKTIVFPGEFFEKSYLQSPWYERFENAKINAKTDPPIQWHIDLGNECNLACKMCHPAASSKISSHYIKWNLINKHNLKKNWTSSDISWEKFLHSIDETPNLKRIHFMGGEPLYNKRLNQCLEYLIEKNRTEISISLVTNGTIFDENLLEKLNLFNTVSIEISVESVESNNDYIRQGSNYSNIICNILKYKKYENENLQVILRSVPQLLSVNNYYKLLEFALDNDLLIVSLPLVNPNYLSINVLPEEIKKQLLPKYFELKQKLDKKINNGKKVINIRNKHNIVDLIIMETDAIIKLLSEPAPDNISNLHKELNFWLSKWDKEYNLSAYDYYPEYKSFFECIDYEDLRN